MSTVVALTALAGLTVGWAAQMWLVLRQTRAVNARLRVLRGQGRTAVGRSGSRLKGFTFIALAANADGRVVAAEALRGATVFAGLKPAPEFIGRSIGELADGAGSARDLAAAQAAQALLSPTPSGPQSRPSLPYSAIGAPERSISK